MGLQQESIQDDIQFKAYHMQMLYLTQSLKFFLIQVLDNEVNLY